MWFLQVFAKWKQILVIPQSFASLLMMSCTFIAMHQNYKVHLLVLHPGKQKCIWLRCSCLTSIHSLNKGKNKENYLSDQKKKLLVTESHLVFYWPLFASSTSIKMCMLQFIMLVIDERHTLGSHWISVRGIHLQISACGSLAQVIEFQHISPLTPSRRMVYKVGIKENNF